MYCSTSISYLASISVLFITFKDAYNLIVFGAILTFSAEGVFLLLLNPRFFASFCHSSPYPLPSKSIDLDFLMYSLKTLNIASSFFKSFCSIKLSTSFLNSISCLATMEFKTVIGFAQLAVEPTALNSNLLPVKAKGDVRFLSVLSSKISGILPTTFNFKSVFSFGDNLPFVTPSSSTRTLDS